MCSGGVHHILLASYSVKNLIILCDLVCHCMFILNTLAAHSIINVYGCRSRYQFNITNWFQDKKTHDLSTEHKST